MKISVTDPDVDARLAELLAEVDLLETFLTGLISELTFDSDSLVLVDRQFELLEVLFEKNSTSEAHKLHRYVDRLRQAYRDLLIT